MILPIRNIPKLPHEQAILAMAIAMEELAVAQMCKIIHTSRPVAAYRDDMGGIVRFDDDGEPCLVLPDNPADWHTRGLVT